MIGGAGGVTDDSSWSDIDLVDCGGNCNDYIYISNNSDQEHTSMLMTNSFDITNYVTFTPKRRNLVVTVKFVINYLHDIL